ncbi:MAG TPA: DUF4344 domain-containing metallopeptidase [Longimicrobium sp.]|nr:DUF4344 domain-containing metallopeptidase [Longimicrobium sp.]
MENGHAQGGPAREYRSAPVVVPGAAPGRGSFRVEYRAVDDSVFAEWQDDFRQARFLEDIAAWMNDWVSVPRNVTLTFAECGESNAFYRPETGVVTVCFELVDDLDHLFEGDRDRDQSVNDALLFTTMHEVGHALVNVLDLPITGREEDAVDQLAAIILVDGAEDGDEAAINGVRGLPDDGQMDDLAFADEHALNGQRFYNVLCLVYGQDPDAYQEWIHDGTLPPERAQRCPAEYDQTRAAWQKLLQPYLKADL